MKISGWIPKDIQSPLLLRRDAVLLPTLFLFNCFEFSSWQHLNQIGNNPWLLLIWVYGLIGLIPLVMRDKYPVTVFMIQCAHTVAAWPILHEYIPVVGIPVALYAVAVHRGKFVSLLALLVSCIPNGLDAISVFWLYANRDTAIRAFIANSLFILLATVGAWGAGRLTRASQQLVQRLESEQKTTKEAVEEERRRIARELHDSVAHAVTVMLLQAAAARAAEIDRDQVRQSLSNIEVMGQQAMAELQRLLGVLVRSDNPANHVTGTGELGPQPGLANLDALLTSAHNSGILVKVHEEGNHQDLDPSVDLAAYRIIQEGLTNIIKHADKNGDPQLTLRWGTHGLMIQIDNGTNQAQVPRGQRASAGGFGLAGLRERAHTVGGHLYTGAHDGVGYRLTATLPFAAPTVPPVVSTTLPCHCSRKSGDQGMYVP